MTESSAFRLAALSPRRYRWADRATKLAGVGLIAAGLDAGGGTPAGIAFAALGVALGLATVLLENQWLSRQTLRTTRDATAPAPRAATS